MSRASKNVRNLASARVVGALKPPASGQADYFDAALKGFGIRLSAAGRMTWFTMYRDADGRRHRFTLGTYPALTVKKARIEAKSIFEAVANGGNPAKEKRSKKMADTFSELSEAYIWHYAKGEEFATWDYGRAIVADHPGFMLQGRELLAPKSYKADINAIRRPVTAYLREKDNPPEPRKRSWHKDQSLIDRDLIPEWGLKKAEAISRADVNRLLDRIVERGAPIQANRTLDFIRKLYSWAIGESRINIDSNPCSEIKKRGQERARDRHLSEDEIRLFWPMAGTDEKPASITESSRLALRLILVTGQRPGEVLGLKWSELDKDWETSDKPIWTLPAKRSKNGRGHRIPLSPLAVSLLIEAQVLASGSTFAFPSPRGKSSMLVSSFSHALSRSAYFGLEPFRPHDLRRTFATHVEGPECGVSRFVVARILNHSDQSVTGRHYSQYQFDTEKREALNAWARRLINIIEGNERKGADVVPLHRGA